LPYNDAKNQTIWCETIDGEARNVFKSGERCMRPGIPVAVVPLRVEGEGFLLTYSGQSAINVFTAFSFNGNFVFEPVEHR
jgi:hypothetical protein